MRFTNSTTAKLAGAASILTMTTLMAASPAHAATSTTESLQHFIDCAGWLFSDPAKHAQECSPGHDVFVSGSTGFSYDPEDCEC